MAAAIALGVSLVLYVGAQRVYAQAASATLHGTVTDESGATIPDTVVTVVNSATALTRTATSDRSGAFSLTFLPPGQYAVTATRQGFAVKRLRELVLNANDQLSIQISLELQGVSDEITISGEVRRASVAPGIGTVVDRHLIANIPLNGRTLHALIQTVPGVVLATSRSFDGGATGGAGQFSVNGQRTTSNSYMVDGVSANTGIAASGGGLPGAPGSGQTPGTTAMGGTSSLVSLDALQEFRIETSTFAPEFGRTPGGQISLITRSGTNEYHGSLSDYFRHERFDANDWFANRDGHEKAKMRQHLFGGVLGGPIRKNRLFLFGSYEGLRLDQPRTAIASVPTAALRARAPAVLQPYLNALPVPNRPELVPGIAEFGASFSDRAEFDVVSVRLDGRISNSVTGFFRLSHAPSQARARTQALSTLTATTSDNDAFTWGATWVAAARLTADIRANWTTNQVRWVQEPDAFGGALVPSVADVFLPGRSPATSQTLFQPASVGFTWGVGTSDEQRQLNVVGAAASVIGAHQLKFGFDYRRLMPRLGGTGGSFENFLFLTSEQVASGTVGVYQLTNADTRPREAVFTNLSIYAQDAWKIGSRLTLTYGARFERVPPPTEASGRPPQTLLGIEDDLLVNPRLAPEETALWNDRAGEIATRAGAAWLVNSTGRWETTIRGGAGIFYDLGLDGIANAFHNVYPFYASKNPRNVPLPLSATVRTPPQLGIDPPQQFYLLDPELRMPYTRQWHLAWEQALGSPQTVTVAYVGAAGRRLLVQQAFQQPLIEWPTTNTAIYVGRNIGRSSYHGLQLQYQRRLHEGLQVLSAYTFSHARDNASADNLYAPPASQAQLLAQEWAPASFDIHHVFSAAIAYDLPVLPGPTTVRTVSRNWGVDLLVRAQSSGPLNVIANSARVDGALFDRRPDIVPGQPFYIDDSNAPGGMRLNRAAFVAPAPGAQGNLGRNALRGFPASQFDLALRREFRLNGPRLQLRIELFNVLNHPNFGTVHTALSSPQFGQATEMLNRSLGGLSALYQIGGSRSTQASVKLVF